MHLTVLNTMSAEKELEKVLASKFFCPAKFAQEIEELVRDNHYMNYIDAKFMTKF